MQAFEQPGTLSSPQHVWRRVLLLFIVIGSLAFMLSKEPFGQNPRYHDFADQEAFVGIPNFADVASNIPFLLVGIAGIVFCTTDRKLSLRTAWVTLFLGVALVAVGSIYYHLSPNSETLVWDRLPMTIGFMGLFAALLGEYVNVRLGKALLIPVALLGCASVVYWHMFDDLRFYYWIQLVPLLTIPAVIVLFRPPHSHRWILLVALLLYALAKIAEANDREVFAFTHRMLSGHTVKHLLAALGCLALLVMLKIRQPTDDEST